MKNFTVITVGLGFAVITGLFGAVIQSGIDHDAQARSAESQASEAAAAYVRLARTLKPAESICEQPPDPFDVALPPHTALKANGVIVVPDTLDAVQQEQYLCRFHFAGGEARCATPVHAPPVSHLMQVRQLPEDPDTAVPVTGQR